MACAREYTGSGSRCRRAAHASTAAWAAASVVIHVTPWATAAARILPSSVRAPLPLGVLMTRATSSFFSTYPKLIWGYLPSIEVQARQYSSYVCSKVIPNPVTFSGNPSPNCLRSMSVHSTSDVRVAS